MKMHVFPVCTAYRIAYSIATNFDRFLNNL